MLKLTPLIAGPSENRVPLRLNSGEPASFSASTVSSSQPSSPLLQARAGAITKAFESAWRMRRAARVPADYRRLHRHVEAVLVDRNDKIVQRRPLRRNPLAQVDRSGRLQHASVDRHKGPAEAHFVLDVHIAGLGAAAHPTALAVP